MTLTLVCLTKPWVRCASLGQGAGGRGRISFLFLARRTRWVAWIQIGAIEPDGSLLQLTVRTAATLDSPESRTSRARAARSLQSHCSRCP